MANNFPTSLNSYVGTETLSAAGHANAHNAYEAKLGTGASTPVANTVFRGTGTGTSGWAALNVGTDVTGTLLVANGGTGAATLTGLLLGNGTSAFTAITTSAGIAGAISDETGSGSLVFATTPTLVTPVLGVATATSINKVAITAPATSATLTIANGKTLTANSSIILAGTDSKTLTLSDSATIATNAITLAGGEVITFTATNALTFTTTNTTTVTLPTSGTLATLAGTETFTNKLLSDSTTSIVDASDATKVVKFDVTGTTGITGTLTTAFTTAKTLTFPDATDTLVGKATTDTLSNKRMTRRVIATTQSATPTINTDNTDVSYITGLAQAITSMTTNLSGTPVNGDSLIISITDNGTARAITWGASFEASGGVTLPTTTVISTRLDVAFLWNTATSKWRCVASA